MTVWARTGSEELDVVTTKEHAKILLEVGIPQEIWDINMPQDEGPVTGSASVRV